MRIRAFVGLIVLLLLAAKLFPLLEPLFRWYSNLMISLIPPQP